MDSFWVKMGVFAAIIVGLIVLVSTFQEKVAEDMEPDTGFYETAAEDRERLMADPVIEEEIEETVTEETEAEIEEIIEEVAQVAPKTAPKEFRELSEAEKYDAERLLSVAIQGRSIGRLPMTGFKLLVDNCRLIIKRYPGTVYEYKAKRALGEVPERYWPRYKITQDEVIIEEEY